MLCARSPPYLTPTCVRPPALLPRSDAAGASEAALGHLELSAVGNGAAPTAADAARLGSESDLAFLSTRLRETCGRVDELLHQLAGVPGVGVEGLDLLNRALKAYLARY